MTELLLIVIAVELYLILGEISGDDLDDNDDDQKHA